MISRSILRLQLPGYQIPDRLADVFGFVEHGVGFINDGRDDGVFARELPGGAGGGRRIKQERTERTETFLFLSLFPLFAPVQFPWFRPWREKQVTVRSPTPLSPVKVWKGTGLEMSGDELQWFNG